MNYRLTELKVLLFLLLLPAVSCQRPMYDEEDDEDGVSQTNLPLKISARSSGESPINYPAYIYAFAEDGIRDRKSTRLNSSHPSRSRMPSSA